MPPSHIRNPGLNSQHLHAQDRDGSYLLNALPEILFSGFLILFVTIRLLEQHAAFLRAPGADWNSSEWMIDYADGFVRRGLGGELLKRLMHLTGLGFFPLWAAITTSIYIATCWHLIRRCYRLGGSRFWRFCLLFNPALLVFPIDCRLYGSFLRKEMLFVAATALLVALCERTLRDTSISAHLLPLPVLGFACLASTVLALMHEGMFLFEWFPLNFVVLIALLVRLRKGRQTATLIALLTLLPALAVTAASIHWHGDARTGQLICQSWHADSIPTVCSVKNSSPDQFDTIGWTASRVAMATLRHAWRFPIFLFIFAILATFELAAIHRLVPAAKLSHLMGILLFPLIIAFPIFLSNDWGRYLFTIMGQQIFLMLSDELRPAVFEALPMSLSGVMTRLAGPRQKLRLDSFARMAESRLLVSCLILLLLPLPDTFPERTLYKESPPAILFHFIQQSRAGDLL